MQLSIRHLAPFLLLILAIGFTPSVSSQPPTANLNVRVYFGEQMGGQAVGPCSEIMIVVTPQNGTPIKLAASGPVSGAKSGQCLANFKNLPAGIPLTLTAVYSDLPSMPDDSTKPPGGKWTNPITLVANQTVSRNIKLYGKP